MATHHNKSGNNRKKMTPLINKEICTLLRTIELSLLNNQLSYLVKITIIGE